MSFVNRTPAEIVPQTEMKIFMDELSRVTERESFNSLMKRFDESFMQRYQASNKQEKGSFPFGSSQEQVPPKPFLQSGYAGPGQYQQKDGFFNKIDQRYQTSPYEDPRSFRPQETNSGYQRPYTSDPLNPAYQGYSPKVPQEMYTTGPRTNQDLYNVPQDFYNYPKSQDIYNNPYKPNQELYNYPPKPNQELYNYPSKPNQDLYNYPPKSNQDLYNYPPKTQDYNFPSNNQEFYGFGPKSQDVYNLPIYNRNYPSDPIEKSGYMRTEFVPYYPTSQTSGYMPLGINDNKNPIQESVNLRKIKEDLLISNKIQEMKFNEQSLPPPKYELPPADTQSSYFPQTYKSFYTKT